MRGAESSIYGWGLKIRISHFGYREALFRVKKDSVTLNFETKADIRSLHAEQRGPESLSNTGISGVGFAIPLFSRLLCV